MSGLEFYIVDTETTGLDSKMHEVTEISIIRCSDRKQLWKKIKCDYPERASLQALQVTNKTLDDLTQGDTKESVVSLCNKFFMEDGLTPAHRCIIGHNIYSFDRRFLFALWEKAEQQFPAACWADTLPMIKAYAKQLDLFKPKFNLAAACDIMGIKKIAARHNARDDTRNNYYLWLELVKKLDYLPFIKTDMHQLPESEELDMSVFE